MSFMEPDVIASNLCLTIEGADSFTLGVLSSEMHMAWVRTVAGRLKGDYRYSNQIAYNNFPWRFQTGSVNEWSKPLIGY